VRGLRAAAVSSLFVFVMITSAPSWATATSLVSPCLLPTERDPNVTEEVDHAPGGRGIRPYAPFRVLAKDCPNYTEDIRGVRVVPGHVQLYVAGSLKQDIAVPTKSEFSLHDIGVALNDPSLVAEPEPGVFDVRIALVGASRARLRLVAPETKLIRLHDDPNVFIGSINADVEIDGIRITSVTRDGSSPDRDQSRGRPFLLFTDGGRADINNSEISFLGSDRSGGYGLSWRGRISGALIHDKIHDNFLGIYTSNTVGMTLQYNDVYKNGVYGIEAHRGSRKLQITDNLVFENGSHGIILSLGCVDSRIANNWVHHNGGSGIVLDENSDRNTVSVNAVEDNKGDGVVITGSADNAVTSNGVRRNRVGLRFNHPNTARIVARDNDVDQNSKGAAAYGGAADITLDSNRFTDNAKEGVLLSAPGSLLTGGEVRGSRVGVDIRSEARVQGVAFHDTGVAISAKKTAVALLANVSGATAMKIDHGATVTAQQVDGSAPSHLVGHLGSAEADTLHSALPYVGAAFVGLAFLLEGFNVFGVRRRSRQVTERDRATV
jgi:parallel beta-helix repeat protein